MKKTMFRAMEIDAIRMVEGEGNERKFTLSFSSETPYSRWGVMEILDHAPNAADLSRLNTIGVVLFNHDVNTVIGKITRAWVENNRGCVDIEFDTDDEAERIYQKVKSGTLKAVSVGYKYDSIEEVKAGSKSADGRFDGPCIIARKWTPLEVSIVSVPADPTVGVSRAENTKYYSEEEPDMDEENRTADETGVASSTTQTDPEAATRAEQAERQRVTTIMDMQRQYNIDLSEHITKGSTVEAVRKIALDELSKRLKGIPAGSGTTLDEGDKFRAAAADAIALRMGTRIDKPAEGANELRGFSISRLAERAVSLTGESTARVSGEDILVKAFMQGGSFFPAIMDTAVNKTVNGFYAMAEPTYLQWCRIGELPDFKPASTYRLGEFGSLKKVGKAGELKEGSYGTGSPFDRQLDTYGEVLSIDRRMIINDDIGQFSRMSQAIAAAAARDINALVYSILQTSSLYSADKANLGTAGALGNTTISELKALLRKQTGVDGKSVLNIPAKYLIVPPELEDLALQLVTSTAALNAINSGVTNIHRNSLTVIVDAELSKTVAGAKAYYLAADNALVDTVEVDFLKGINAPSIDMFQMAGQLGVQWNIYMDYGAVAGDYRGMAKNAGQ